MQCELELIDDLDIMQLKIVELVLEEKELLDKEEDVKFDKEVEVVLDKEEDEFPDKEEVVVFYTRRWKLWLTKGNRRMLIVIRRNDAPCERQK